MRWLLAATTVLGALAATTFPTWFRTLHERLSAIPVAVSDLPHPTGPYGVGRTQTTLPAKGAPGRPEGTSIVVDLWYPSAARDLPEQRPGPSPKGFGLNQTTHAGAAVDGPVASAAAPFPLLVYAPGWDGERDDNTYLFANLASHGYVVAALDDIGFVATANDDAAAVFGDLGDLDLSSEAAMKQSVRDWERRLVLMTDRVSRALDELETLDRSGELSLLHGHIDHHRIGMIGFSFGGSVAAECALIEPRVLAAINMDGGVFGRAATTIISKPYLVFNSDDPTLAADAKSSNPRRRYYAILTIADREQQLRQAKHPDTTALLFHGHDHSDFTDDLFAPSLPGYIKHWRRTSRDRLAMRAAQDETILAFLDRYLRGAQPPKQLPVYAGVEPLARASQLER
jgi:dienelactone hydrolase